MRWIEINYGFFFFQQNIFLSQNKKFRRILSRPHIHLSYSCLCQKIRLRQINDWDIVNAAVDADRLDQRITDDGCAFSVLSLAPCHS